MQWKIKTEKLLNELKFSYSNGKNITEHTMAFNMLSFSSFSALIFTRAPGRCKITKQYEITQMTIFTTRQRNKVKLLENDFPDHWIWKFNNPCYCVLFFTFSYLFFLRLYFSSCIFSLLSIAGKINWVILRSYPILTKIFK